MPRQTRSHGRRIRLFVRRLVAIEERYSDGRRWKFPHHRAVKPTKALILGEGNRDKSAACLDQAQLTAARKSLGQTRRHTDGWRWKFHHKNAGKRTRYAWSAQGTLQNRIYQTST